MPGFSLARVGAVAAEGVDAGVASHFGNPFAEQRFLTAGGAIVQVPRGIVTVSGEDRLTWLHSLTSQQLDQLAPGGSAESLLLGQTGRIEHVLRIIDDGHTTWLLVEPGETADLAGWLESMRFMMRVEVADRSSDFSVFGFFGDSTELSAPPAAPNGTPIVWRDPWRELVTGGHQYSTVVEHPAAQWSYREFLIEAGTESSLADVPLAGTLALEALRIAAWRPRFATEVDEKAIPHEFDWLRSSVHLSKGCYRGQETIAKVHNLG
ncbi:MAG TPA: folate-binding protein, partial [Terrimesophilobacter sp.]|nr:folate-binding protein [Terrimesophilobacter sp.]